MRHHLGAGGEVNLKGRLDTSSLLTGAGSFKKKVVLVIAIYQLIRVKGTTKHTLRTATTGTSLARDGRVLTGGALTGALASWTGAY
jgi:hypothetical protein